MSSAARRRRRGRRKNLREAPARGYELSIP